MPAKRYGALNEKLKKMTITVKVKMIIYEITIMTIVASCASKSDYDKLQSENIRLKTDLEECQHGADKLIAIVEKAYSEKNYLLARQNIKLFSEKHPESPKNEDFKTLLMTIEKEELIENKRKKAEEKERNRLKNLDSTGMWIVAYRLDDFLEPTKDAGIVGTDAISGTYSNKATQGKQWIYTRLKVVFVINSSSDISILLYDVQTDNNLINNNSSQSYSVLIQDKDKERLKLRAVNCSRKLCFDKTASGQVHNVLMKGGLIKFIIDEIDEPNTRYRFTIENADLYENAYIKLEESQ